MTSRKYKAIADLDDDVDIEQEESELQNELDLDSKRVPDFDPYLPRYKAHQSTRDGEFRPNESASSGTYDNINAETRPKQGSFTIAFYARYFDVDTSDVLLRCRSVLIPRSKFSDVVAGNPDLYGPFWIATTVVMILFLAGSISRFLALSDSIGHVQYDIRMLSAAAGLIYGYSTLVPIGLWATLKWFGSKSVSFIECIALYGYANIIWLPVALISWSRLQILNLTFVGIGFLVSLLFILRNLMPMLSATDHQTSKILIVFVSALHAGLAVFIKVLFFV